MKARIGQNPEFATITGLTNRTFNPASITEGQMITEAQMLEVYERIVADEAKADACCRDIIFWEARVQVVRMNTLNISAEKLFGGGAVVSTFDENVNFGSMRRGLSYTVTFPIKWNDSLYVSRNISALSYNNCSINTSNVNSFEPYNIIYRIVEDNSIGVANCQSTNNNYSKFWYRDGKNISTSVNNDPEGYKINPQNNWGQFVYDVKDDGTVTITDNRRNVNFDIIRFYTQWILRETADGQMIPDPE